MTQIKPIIAIALLVICEFSFAGQSQNPIVNDRDINVRIFEDVQYPPLAYMARIQGVVTVQVKLGEQGRVVEAVANSGPELLAAASVNNAKRWVFKPNSAKAAVIIYDYKILDGRCNKNSSLFILQGTNLATVLACPPIVNESSSDK
jgi:TonB family protein